MQQLLEWLCHTCARVVQTVNSCCIFTDECFVYLSHVAGK